MILFRRIQEHRPIAVLIALVALSLLSLATETQASLIQRGIVRVVDVTSYPFLKVSNLAQHAASRAYHFVVDHEQVFEENKALRQDKVRLSAGLANAAELRRENARLRAMADFEREHPEFEAVPAAVLQSSKGMLTIDLGAKDGIKAPACVVTAEGVVGIVTEVGDISSKVASLHHPDGNVGAMVRRNRLRAYDGMIHASSSFRVLCTLDYIDMKDDVRQGDQVVTSPESIFPTGYPIGVISSPPRGDGPLWRSADVVPYVDPYRLDEVFVLRRAARDPENLAGPYESAAEWTAPGGSVHALEAEAAPDERPLQEQYAP